MYNIFAFISGVDDIFAFISGVDDIFAFTSGVDNIFAFISGVDNILPSFLVWVRFPLANPLELCCGANTMQGMSGRIQDHSASGLEWSN